MGEKVKSLDKYLPNDPEKTNEMLEQGLDKIFSSVQDFNKGGAKDEDG